MSCNRPTACSAAQPPAALSQLGGFRVWGMAAAQGAHRSVHQARGMQSGQAARRLRGDAHARVPGHAQRVVRPVRRAAVQRIQQAAALQ